MIESGFQDYYYWPSNSPYSSDSFLYKWGENGSFFLDTWTWQCVMDFPTILLRKKGENLKRRRRDCGCRLFSDWLEKERGDWKKHHINKRKKCQFYGSFTFQCFRHYFGFSTVLIDWYHFKLITWIIPGQLHTPFVVLERNPSIFDCLAVLRLEAITNKDHKI